MEDDRKTIFMSKSWSWFLLMGPAKILKFGLQFYLIMKILSRASHLCHFFYNDFELS